VVAKKGTFKNVEMYAAAVAYHCEKMSRLKWMSLPPVRICFAFSITFILWINVCYGKMGNGVRKVRSFY
jgi:hypothetical protein